MSQCHKQKSCWCNVIVVILLGGLLLLGIASALIFGFSFKNLTQPNDATTDEIALTSNDSTNIIYENIEPQPVFINVEFLPGSDTCEAEVTLESKNGNTTETIKFDSTTGLQQAITLVGKKVTKSTVEASVADDELCRLEIHTVNGIHF
ncbi:hypothetical protein [Jeotgalibacillus marinus]|uniref:Uncharacterized protein n=1 Tax=Jeotgalibacillus marinus TaxID=86667 RepID=A0ABV3Q5A7_9BACL